MPYKMFNTHIKTYIAEYEINTHVHIIWKKTHFADFSFYSAIKLHAMMRINIFNIFSQKLHFYQYIKISYKNINSALHTLY